MPWARIPPDKLINLPLFGIDVIVIDGDYLWLRGPSGRMRVKKLMPRVFFESVDDAHQCGAMGIRIVTEIDQKQHDAIIERLNRENETERDGEASAGDEQEA